MKYLNRQPANESGKTAVLLVNLGTPDAPSTSAVRRYLKEFLWDPRLVEIPRLVWWLILNGVILRIRPARSAKAYRSIWTKEGSPLLVATEKLTSKVRTLLTSENPNLEVEMAMRYGSPSINSVLTGWNEKALERLIVLPLYPQYSATSSASVMDAVMQELKFWRCVPDVQMVRDYHVYMPYIEALAASVRKYVETKGKPDRFLLSFHGIPRRCVDKGDPYAQQCRATAQALARQLGWQEDDWQLTFQSRFGREEWLQPYTDKTLEKLPSEGIKRLAVLCPGFAVDCLETLEEIDEENREIFMLNGGEQFDYIPALNDSDLHAESLKGLIETRLGVFNQ